MNHSEDNAAYEAAKCTKPHADGTRCMPSWDGFVYICLTEVVRSK